MIEPFPFEQLINYLTIGAALFALGMIGFLARRNMIVMFLSAEMMLQGVAINLVAFARYRGNLHGQAFVLFILTAVISAYAGVTSSIRVSAANPNSGTGYELEVIAMVVIGGTAFTGGRGTIIGTVIGVLILRTMRDGIVLVGVPGLAYNIFIGVIILGMMALHSWLERRHHAGT